MVKYILLKTLHTNQYMDTSGKHFNNINTLILFNITYHLGFFSQLSKNKVL